MRYLSILLVAMLAPVAAAGEMPTPPIAEASQIEGLGPAVTEARLQALRGGENTVDNAILVEGEVSNNSADRIVSGTNRVGGGAFGNAAGVSTVIQNSGSNVLIQNSMIVNVQFADPSP